MAATMAMATAEAEAEAAERRWSRKAETKEAEPAVIARGGASVTFACAVGRSRLMTRLTDEGQTSGSITAGRAWDEIPSLQAGRDVKLH